MKLIVLCGGFGTKLWPASRQDLPKHFVDLIGGKTLLQRNIDVLLQRFKPSDIYISGSLHHVDLLRKQIPQIPESNFLLEPEMKHTGPAFALAMAKLFVDAPNEVFSSVQADELRLPESKFLDLLEKIDELVSTEKRFLTGGIVTPKPIAGVDYIEIGKQLKDYSGVEAYEVIDFLGRTDYEGTKDWVETKKVLAHTTNFSWIPSLWIEKFKEYTPDWYENIQALIKVFSSDNYSQDDVNKIYSTMRPGKINDELVTHFYPEAMIVNLPFEWIDFGTWESVAKYVKKHGEDNPHERRILIDSENVYVRADNPSKVVSVIGLDGVAIIDTKDGLLVTKLEQSGKVGEVVAKLKEESSLTNLL